VAEAAAVSAPDPIRFEKVVVFVCCARGSPLRAELQSRHSPARGEPRVVGGQPQDRWCS